MKHLGWKDWLAVLVVGLLVGGVAFGGLLQIQQWRQDTATLRAVVQLLNYNVAQGKLVIIPQEPPPVPAPVLKSEAPQ